MSGNKTNQRKKRVKQIKQADVVTIEAFGHRLETIKKSEELLV